MFPQMDPVLCVIVILVMISPVVYILWPENTKGWFFHNCENMGELREKLKAHFSASDSQDEIVHAFSRDVAFMERDYQSRRVGKYSMLLSPTTIPTDVARCYESVYRRKFAKIQKLAGFY